MKTAKKKSRGSWAGLVFLLIYVAVMVYACTCPKLPVVVPGNTTSNAHHSEQWEQWYEYQQGNGWQDIRAGH